MRIVLEIIREIRTRVPPSFCIGIKLNSVDHQESGDLKESLEQIKLIVNEGIDFIEISGGTYEDPKAVYSPASRCMLTRNLDDASSL